MRKQCVPGAPPFFACAGDEARSVVVTCQLKLTIHRCVPFSPGECAWRQLVWIWLLHCMATGCSWSQSAENTPPPGNFKIAYQTIPTPYVIHCCGLYRNTSCIVQSTMYYCSWLAASFKYSGKFGMLHQAKISLFVSCTHTGSNLTCDFWCGPILNFLEVIRVTRVSTAYNSSCYMILC